MPRKLLIRVSEYPYHVFARSNNQEWFHIPIVEVWYMSIAVLKTVTEKYNARIQSFVLMNNHFHMLVWTPQSNIDSVMNYFLRELSKKISAKANRINHVFGGPYKWSIIQTGLHMAIVYKYIYRNPVVAGLVKDILDYPFSTIHYIKENQFTFPFFDDYCELSEEIPKRYSKKIIWLNEPFNNEQYKFIEKALKKRIFSFSKKASKRKCVKNILQDMKS